MADKEQLTILKKGVEEWNKWRKSASRSPIDLLKTDLSHANLSGADLSDANLSHAILYNTNLLEATLYGTNFTGARTAESIFAFSNLKEAIGLDTIIFEGPCSIDYETLMRSGNLPLSFLRGCGLPDDFIELLPSLRNEPFQFYSCFISHS